MASITIRNLEESIKNRLRLSAARNRRSMEEEARHILRESLTGRWRKQGNLFEAIRRRIEAVGGLELDIPRRGRRLREPPRFDG